MEPQLIHHLVAFPASYIEVQDKLNNFDKKKDEQAWEIFKNSSLYRDALIGGRHRGSYLNKQQLIDRVLSASDMYDICEGYYEYLVIETHQLNCIDGLVFDPPDFKESEMWFKYRESGYVPIDKPECLKQLCGFL